MTIKELLEYTKDELKEIRDDFLFFQTNDFEHLKKKVDWIFVFMSVTAMSTIGTLIAVIFRMLGD